MEKTTCALLITLVLSLVALVAVCVAGGYRRDVKMAELGYEQGVVPGSSFTVWLKAK